MRCLHSVCIRAVRAACARGAGAAEAEGVFHSGSRARDVTTGVAVHRIGADRHLADAFLGAGRVLPGPAAKAALLAALPARDRLRFLSHVRALGQLHATL
jgi:hypothetical protein